MLIVETIAKIRRLHFTEGKGIKTICRDLKLSKKVVRKVIRTGITEFTYSRTVQPRPKLGAWLEDLGRLLAINAARGRRERLTLIQIYEELRGLGYEGGYDAVRRYASVWARTGGSEAGLNWLGYIIQNAPGIAMLVMPSLDMVRRNTTVRIDPLIEATPALRELVAAPRSRDAGNSLFRKSFPGGQLVMTGANSAVGLRSTPVRYLFLDEVDGYPGDADGEGDPVDLAIQRTATFRGRRKIYMVSTPTLKGHSRIEAAFEHSDRRFYHVPCQHCGDMAPITWARIRWPEGQRDQAHLVCEACGGIHHEHEKPRLLASGEWRPTAEGDGRTAGFHLSALYSPWETWAEIAAEHGRVRKDPARLQVWVNTKLGESWEDQAGDTIPADPLMARREDWGEALPASVAVLTAGVDVQGDRIEVQILGWGRDEEAWVIDYRVLWGDPSGPRLWADLDMVLQATFPHPAGLDLPVRAAAIDTGGHHTKMAYEFCRTRLARRIWAIKGRGGPGIPVWPRRPTRSNKAKIPLFIVGVDAVKDAVYARLKLSEPGPGAIHFPRCLDADYFRQLTAERVVTRFEKGRPIRSWQPKRDGERNEALDTFVYAHAALHGLISMGMRLNEEAVRIPSVPTHMGTVVAPIIRSAWMR